MLGKVFTNAQTRKHAAHRGSAQLGETFADLFSP